MYDTGGVKDDGLYRAVMQNDSALAQRLLGEGADPSVAPKRNGNTPLHLAAFYADSDMARVLMDGGAPIEARDANGCTPLLTATLSYGKGTEVIRLLLAAGANPAVENDHGVSPLSLSQTLAGFPDDGRAELRNSPQ